MDKFGRFLFLAVLIADVMIVHRYGRRLRPRRFARVLGFIGRTLTRWSDELTTCT